MPQLDTGRLGTRCVRPGLLYALPTGGPAAQTPVAAHGAATGLGPHRPSIAALHHICTSLPVCLPQAIALSYMLIVVMGNAIGVLIAMTLHRCGQAAVGSPPVTQVVVDVLGILLTCLVCSAVYGTSAAPGPQAV